MKQITYNRVVLVAVLMTISSMLCKDIVEESIVAQEHTLDCPEIIYCIPQPAYHYYRNTLKHQLFLCQEGSMNQNQFDAFVEPYLQEAEESFQILQYIESVTDARICKSNYFPFSARYFDCMFNYVRALFAKKEAKILQCEQSFQQVIVLIKEYGRLNELDEVQELQMVKDLIARAYKEFIEHTTI